MSGYSIVEGLVYNIIAMTADHELNPFERLFVALRSGSKCHAGYLTDTYMACGCFEKALEHYQSTQHHRKLGDLAWILGDPEAAETHFSDASSGAQSYRTEPDHDRLIRLAFFQEDWNSVIRRFTETGFSPGFSNGQVCCGRSSVSANPYLEMLAVAQAMTGEEPLADVLEDLQEAFGVSEDEWGVFVSSGDFDQRKTIDKIKRRCPPKFGKRSPISVERALATGATQRAHRVLAYVKRGDDIVDCAQESLARFGQDGDERDLADFVDCVTGSGVTAVGHSMLFAAMGHDSFNPKSAPPDRMIRLYASHPIMNKRYFGRLLQLKFENGYGLTGGDIVTGLFQKMGSFDELLKPSPSKEEFDFKKLSQFRDWAELRLDDWVKGSGMTSAKVVVDAWLSGTAVEVQQLFGGASKKYPNNPRDMDEWKSFLNQAAHWLRTAWDKEIGKSQWVSENQLFQLLRRHLKSVLVEQHARPIWVEPQHLDVYIPAASTAVEFMGEQHYRPIDFFGGTTGFAAVQMRDKRKQELCRRNGIELIYVRFDESIPDRAAEIAAKIKMTTAIPDEITKPQPDEKRAFQE